MLTIISATFYWRISMRSFFFYHDTTTSITFYSFLFCITRQLRYDHSAKSYFFFFFLPFTSCYSFSFSSCHFFSSPSHTSDFLTPTCQKNLPLPFPPPSLHLPPRPTEQHHHHHSPTTPLAPQPHIFPQHRSNNRPPFRFAPHHG